MKAMLKHWANPKTAIQVQVFSVSEQILPSFLLGQYLARFHGTIRVKVSKEKIRIVVLHSPL